MPRLILTTIGHARRAFSHLPEPEDRVVAKALTLLRSSEGDDTGMGFPSRSQDIPDVKRMLDEHGLELDTNQLQKLIEYRKEMEELKRARIHFFVQIGISLVAMVVALIVLVFGNPGKELTQGLFGLLGTVVGYWLR